jgi:hypothetical protein
MFFSFFARTLAFRAGVGNDASFAVTLGAGGDIGELPKKALLHTLYFSAAVAIAAAGILASRSGSAAVAVGALLRTVYPDISTAAESRLFKGNGNPLMQV